MAAGSAVGALKWTCVGAVLGLALSWRQLDTQAGEARTRSSGRASARTDSELNRARADVLEKIKETRAGAEKLLALHEREQQQSAEEFQRRRELYQQGLIARSDMLQAEHALALAILKVEEDKRWIAETDSVMAEAVLRDELMRLPRLAVGGYSETPTLLRFNGAADWRVADVVRIERFFVQAFGRALPISAMGQTPTHDRLRFDHRDGVDVAVHPDSREGQSLLNYLRSAGIPFIAFRGAVIGSSTGAHIHIGKPSPRL